MDLRDITDFAAYFFGSLVEDENCPAVRCQKPHDELQQRGFASAVGSENTDEFSLCDRKIDILEYRIAVKRKIHTIELDGGRIYCW